MVWVLVVVLVVRPASVLKEVSVELVLVVVTPDSEVTEVLKDTLVPPLKDTMPRAMAISTATEATIAMIFFLLIFFSFLRSLPLKNFFIASAHRLAYVDTQRKPWWQQIVKILTKLFCGAYVACPHLVLGLISFAMILLPTL